MAKAGCIAPGACNGPTSKAFSSVTWAKKFIGSMQLCARKGAVYVRSIIFAAFLNAVSGSPSFLNCWAGFAAYSCICCNCLLVLSSVPGTVTSFFLPPHPNLVSFFSPSGSQVTFNFFRAFITSHVVLPTTTSKSLKDLVSKIPCSKPSSYSFNEKTFFIPGMLKVCEASKDFSFMPKAGGCSIIAISIPSCL